MVYPLQFVHINSVMFSEGKGGYKFLNKIFFFFFSLEEKGKKMNWEGNKKACTQTALPGVL